LWLHFLPLIYAECCTTLHAWCIRTSLCRVDMVEGSLLRAEVHEDI
jgi:hypothetical protein